MKPLFTIMLSIFEAPKVRVVPKLNNDTGKTLIQTVSKSSFTPSNSYIITSKNGSVIVVDPTSMSSEEELDLRPDVITVTHPHSDHLDPAFLDRHDCRKSISQVESFDLGDVHIYSIASSHRGSHISVKNPSNVIYVFEVDGLRIAHMGDIGQDHLTVQQLESLGKIDVAFMQFSNPFSGMFYSDKGFNVIEELKPQIIIPTHSNPRSTRKIGKMLGKLEILENSFAVSPQDLDGGQRKVVWLKNTLKY
ncbi:Beta-lactamase superfamily domain protein [anaerobic digester metagenome]